MADPMVINSDAVIEHRFSSGIRTLSTTRRGGVSDEPYASWNLGGHVGDSPDAVRENRRRLQAHLPSSVGITWLHQVHGTKVVYAGGCEAGEIPEADAVWTDSHETAGAVMTADCLPVVFAATDGSCAAVSHAGWRGLAAGVLSATLEALPMAPPELEVWLGPAIGRDAFAVGSEVRQAFIERMGETASRCFTESHLDQASAIESSNHTSRGLNAKWRCDLYSLARLQLRDAGVASIAGGDRCTYTESDDFFSYRRDGQTGRMATVVWLAP